jgi:hypothetical protein
MQTRHVATTLAILLAMMPMAAMAEPSEPRNDNFRPGSSLKAGDSVSGSNVGATVEEGEPTSIMPCMSVGTLDYGSTVWFHVRGLKPGSVTLSTDGSMFDTVLLVATGNHVDDLTVIGCDDDSGAGPASQLSFTAERGQQYHVQVAGYNGAQGDFVLTVA